MTDYAKIIDSEFIRQGVDAHVSGKTVGPSVTRYKITLGRGVKVNQVERLRNELAYACAARKIRIELVPGESAVGIELPNDTRTTVNQSDMSANGLVIGIGKDIEGNEVTMDLAQLPHLLVAGSTGSGKSSFINSLLVSLLKSSPKDVTLTMIDPKVIELSGYNGIAHLREPVITEVDDAVLALRDLCDEMELRYRTMGRVGARSIDGLGLPRIVIVIDELADLMMSAKATEELLVRIAQKGRAAGLHLVCATQRPSADVIPSRLKTNIASRLAFAVASGTDSRVILDENGAEMLLGKGDGLFKPLGQRDAIRIQGALVTDQEIAEAVKQATLEETPTEQFPAVTVEMSGLESIAWRVPVQHSLDDIVQYAMKAANNAARYRRWIPSLPHTLHESEAVTRLILELEEAHQALAEITDRLKGMEKVA